jgi:glycosyltransferase involved in cell wall biosynthesis
VPFQNDVASAYRGLDVVVHASERPEPFGRTIVEAMACGRAVVVARAGGAEELFEDGRSGLGFRPGDAADLARALLTLARDEALRADLARAGRENAVARFGRDRLAAEAFAAYEALVGTQRIAPFRTVDPEGAAIYGTRRNAEDG